ncbi:hypothetical protein LB505_014519 [Fusarium chuoi]|nr:hypothetical protein LB505_014519 [Fusarium chuoi]
MELRRVPWKPPGFKTFKSGTSSTQDSEGFLTLMADMAGWSAEEFHVFIAKFRREIRDVNYHAYSRMKAVWGRKPPSADN